MGSCSCGAPLGAVHTARSLLCLLSARSDTRSSQRAKSLGDGAQGTLARGWRVQLKQALIPLT